MNKQETQTAVLGGGCFWCTEAIFQNLKGVVEVLPGYAGGHTINPTYEQVCSGRTGHAEVIKITFDPKEICYRDLLEVFFATHDPTTLNKQGNDIGTEYRSIIFYSDHEQKAETKKYIKELSGKKEYDAPLVTEIKPLEAFYPAEDYHRNFFEQHREAPYCQIIISPKLRKLREKFGTKLKKDSTS